ncbi:hypothetical protein [Ornithinimicrobium kibberense]|uniref:hypothetical protein n=1 Tax=Ornithinimicrobium kibberense TaxID=282060 RepID=UPI0036188F46
MTRGRNRPPRPRVIPLSPSTTDRRRLPCPHPPHSDGWACRSPPSSPSPPAHRPRPSRTRSARGPPAPPRPPRGTRGPPGPRSRPCRPATWPRSTTVPSC